MNVAFFVAHAAGRPAARSPSSSPSCWSALFALFMVVYGAKLVDGDLVQHDRRFPVAVGRRHLSADPARRRDACCCSSIERLLIGPPPPLAAPSPTPSRSTERSAAMDIFVLLGTLFVCFVIGVPIAYSLALAAHRRRVLDRHPARSGDAEDLRRRQQGRDADHPVLRARRRHHGGGRHGAPPGRLRRRAGRLHPRARRPLGRQRAGDHVPERHLRLGGRRHLGDRLGDDPADGEGRLSARVRHQRDDHAPRCRRCWCRRATTR